MNINVFKDYDELSEKTAEFIADFVKTKTDARLCLAAGDTPTGTFKNMVGLSKEGRASFSGCTFVGLDEWVGMDENDEGSCKNYVYNNLFIPLAVKKSKIVFFDACADNLEAECRRIDDYIKNNGPIDLMLVGIGMNGHIGLNEPGVSFDSYSHIVKLDPVTKNVGQKYFKEKTDLEMGITLGIRHLMESKCAILIANGTKKAEIIRKVVKGEVTNKIPASILQRHKNCYLFLDKDAASMLDI